MLRWERGKNVFAGLLILSVCLNLYGLGRINALTEEIRQSRHEVSRLQHYIDSGLASVRSTVEGIREEERWMSRVSVSGRAFRQLDAGDADVAAQECPVNASVRCSSRAAMNLTLPLTLPRVPAEGF